MDRVALFNELIKIIKVVNGDKTSKATSENNNISEVGLDSLDIVMLCMHIAELYGLDDEQAKKIPLESIKEAFDYAENAGTQKPESVEAAVEAVK
jgi:acyl carrier protein